MAFLRPPGMEALYSGVLITIASAEEIASRRRWTGAGAGSVSMSSL